MSFSYFVTKKCLHCGGDTEEEIPLIEALNQSDLSFGEDMREQIEALRSDLAYCRKQHERLVQMNRRKKTAYASQLALAEKEIEAKAAKILGIQETKP